MGFFFMVFIDLLFFFYYWFFTPDAWGEPICGRDYLFRADCFAFPELQ